MANQNDLLDIYENFDLEGPLGAPVYVAARKDKIVGFLATQERKDAVVAGPLMVNLKSKAVVTMRLVDGYDNLLRDMGIVLYWFFVEKGNKWNKWMEQVTKTGMYTKIGEQGDNIWFKREL